MGQNLPDVRAVADGLFPANEDECAQLKAAGFACMGFRPAVRYSLPANAFKVGSAEIPDTLKKQLDVFAEVLKAKRGSGKTVRIEGHADASGAASTNLALSQRRAEAVKGYLVDLGAEAAMLEAVGMGDKAPKVKDPYSAENRRVEIGRATPPS
jgi:outer membrane protein OmpA-like peptidoglycan-associated protein